jgi:hypothetical protein
MKLLGDSTPEGLTDPDGAHHGFLATPVPEPSTILLLAIGMVGLIGWGSWRSKQIA